MNKVQCVILSVVFLAVFVYTAGTTIAQTQAVPESPQSLNKNVPLLNTPDRTEPTESNAAPADNSSRFLIGNVLVETGRITGQEKLNYYHRKDS